MNLPANEQHLFIHRIPNLISDILFFGQLTQVEPFHRQSSLCSLVKNVFQRNTLGMIPSPVLSNHYFYVLTQLYVWLLKSCLKNKKSKQHACKLRNFHHQELHHLLHNFGRRESPKRNTRIVFVTDQNYFEVILFLNQFIFFKPGQFVSPQLRLGQIKNTGHRPQVTGHSCLPNPKPYTLYRKYPKHSLKLTLGLIIGLNKSFQAQCQHL